MTRENEKTLRRDRNAARYLKRHGAGLWRALRARVRNGRQFRGVPA